MCHGDNGLSAGGHGDYSVGDGDNVRDGGVEIGDSIPDSTGSYSDNDGNIEKPP